MSSLDKYKRVKVLVGVPSLTREWHEKFAMSLLYLMTHWQETRMGNFREETVKVASVRGSILSNVRLDLVKEAIRLESSHLLLVDTDQTFPKDTLHRLMAADKDVIACNIATKQIPAQPTARYFNPNNLHSGDRVYNNPRKGVEEVWRVGCGVMLIRMKVFEKTGLDVWGMPWQPEAQKYQGEDWTFVAACQEAGIKTFIDHVLSEEVKHIGDYAYDHNVVGDVQLEPIIEVANG